MPVQDFIVLRGSANHGKTSTLLILIDKLRSLYSNADYTHFATRSERDCFAKFVINGKVIGISTFGDDKPTIQRSFNFFIQHEVDIAIMAIRAKGTTVFKFFDEEWKNRSFPKPNFVEKIGVTKPARTKQTEAVHWTPDNTATAETLLSLIRELI